MTTPTASNIYGYNGSLPLAVIFTTLYAILTFTHFYLSTVKPGNSSSKHRYTISTLIASTLLTTGYGIRAASIQQPSSIGLYATSASLVVIAPIFVCASLYWCLMYLIHFLLPGDPQQRLFKVDPRWLGRLFITSDVLSFLTQGAGSGIASSGSWDGNTKDIGVAILLAGLGLQLATFTVFLVFLWRLVCRVHAVPEAKFESGSKGVLVGMGIAAVFVQIRTVYRLVEFILGIDGYLFQHEWCLYVFEAVPMLLALTSLAWWHPVRYLQTKPYFKAEVVDNNKKAKAFAAV